MIDSLDTALGFGVDAAQRGWGYGAADIGGGGQIGHNPPSPTAQDER